MIVAAALLDATEIACLSGLDYVTALAEGRAAAPPMNDVIPFEVVSVSESGVKLRAEPEARFHNPMKGGRRAPEESCTGTEPPPAWPCTRVRPEWARLNDDEGSET